jgi:hypothetical protein
MCNLLRPWFLGLAQVSLLFAWRVSARRRHLIRAIIKMVALTCTACDWSVATRAEATGTLPIETKIFCASYWKMLLNKVLKTRLRGWFEEHIG